MNDNEQTQVPEWAKGEGWEWSQEFEEPAATHWKEDITIFPTRIIMCGDALYGPFPTPEDARHIADCLIAGKVLPSKREKELEEEAEALKAAIKEMRLLHQ